MAVAAILAIHIGMVWWLRVPSMTTGNDQAWYMLLARSLTHFSYDNLQFVEVTPHTKFPPVYPALLALFGVTSFDRFDIGIAANALLSATALGLTYGIVRRTSRVLALFVVAVCSVNPLVVSVAGSLLSEPLFMALSALALFALTRPDPSRRSTIIVIAALVVASLTRPIGITVILAIMLLWAMQRRWRSVVALGFAGALSAGSWLGWSATATGKLLAGQSYLADAVYTGGDTPPVGDAPPSSLADSFPTRAHARRERAPMSGTLDFEREAESVFPGAGSAPDLARLPAPSDAVAPVPSATNQQVRAKSASTSFAEILAQRIARNARLLSVRIIPAVLAVPLTDKTQTDSAIWLTVALALSVPGLALLVRRLPALVLATSAYLALLVLWPYVLLRYVGPVIPAILAVLLGGALAIGERAGLRRGWVRYLFPGILALTLVAMALVQDVTKWRAVVACDRPRAASSKACFSESAHNYFAAVAAARELPNDSSNFLVSKEALFHVLTGRYAAWEAEAAQMREPALLDEYLRRQNVSYVLLSRTSFNQWSLAEPLKGLCARLRVIREFGPKVSLLRIVEQGAPGANACPQVSTWSESPWPENPPRIW